MKIVNTHAPTGSSPVRVLTDGNQFKALVELSSDGTAVDPTHVHDDSAFRGTIWALASTTIGVTLHETGHAMGRPHCTDKMGIMTRGFDHFHCVFTFADPPSSQNKQARKFSSAQEAYFSPVSASFLRWSHWFQIDAPTTAAANDAGSRHLVEVDEAPRLVRINSDAGIPRIGFHSKDRIEISFDEIQEMQPGVEIRRIVVVSRNGASQNVWLPQSSL